MKLRDLPISEHVDKTIEESSVIEDPSDYIKILMILLIKIKTKLRH